MTDRQPLETSEQSPGTDSAGVMGDAGVSRRSFLTRVVVGTALAVPALRALASPATASAACGLPCEDCRCWCEVTDSFCSNGTWYHWIDCWDIYTYQYCHSFLTPVGCCPE
jgi:hypothetical protein